MNGSFLPFNWVALSVFAGVLAGGGQMLARAAQLPSYLVIGVIGFVWFVCSLVLMTAGSKVLPIMGLRESLAASGTGLLLILAASLLFWVENIARFDAILKAPYVVLVLILIEAGAACSLLLLDVSWQYFVHGRVATITFNQGIGFVLTLAGIVFFMLDKGNSPS